MDRNCELVNCFYNRLIAVYIQTWLINHAVSSLTSP